ncbi:MAG: T9SS type A sorting domain-containing protein, partial [Candidatus Neomarinimicrobiota bacterium]|nr:T9SS type A sorting domain-containing protein [Candidatus Neomarinimicrobiota bacterium]
YPNPFNASTTIRYSSLQLGDVYISIIGVAGDHINTIHIVNQIPGTHLYNWMGTDYLGHRVPSGIYFLSVASSGTRKTRKIILLK